MGLLFPFAPYVNAFTVYVKHVEGERCCTNKRALHVAEFDITCRFSSFFAEGETCIRVCDITADVDNETCNP